VVAVKRDISVLQEVRARFRALQVFIVKLMNLLFPLVLVVLAITARVVRCQTLVAFRKTMTTSLAFQVDIAQPTAQLLVCVLWARFQVPLMLLAPVYVFPVLLASSVLTLVLHECQATARLASIAHLASLLLIPCFTFAQSVITVLLDHLLFLRVVLVRILL